MKHDEEEIAEAIRLEHDEVTDRLFIVFEVSNLKYKQMIKEKWSSSDLEFKIINKKLIINK